MKVLHANCEEEISSKWETHSTLSISSISNRSLPSLGALTIDDDWDSDTLPFEAVQVEVALGDPIIGLDILGDVCSLLPPTTQIATDVSMGGVEFLNDDTLVSSSMDDLRLGDHWSKFMDSDFDKTETLAEEAWWKQWAAVARNRISILPVNIWRSFTNNLEDLLQRLYCEFQKPPQIQARMDELSKTFCLVLVTDDQVRLELYLWYEDESQTALYVEVDVGNHKRDPLGFDQVIQRIRMVVTGQLKGLKRDVEAIADETGGWDYRLEAEPDALVALSEFECEPMDIQIANQAPSSKHKKARLSRKKAEPTPDKFVFICESAPKPRRGPKGGVCDKNATQRDPREKADFARGEILLQDTDCLIGRAPHLAERSGNKFFRKVVKRFCNEYKYASSRDERANVVLKVMEGLKEQRCRVVVRSGEKHYLVKFNPFVDRKVRDLLRELYREKS